MEENFLKNSVTSPGLGELESWELLLDPQSCCLSPPWPEPLLGLTWDGGLLLSPRVWGDAPLFSPQLDEGNGAVCGSPSS